MGCICAERICSVLDKDEDGVIFARCEELHVNSEGKTEEEAIKNVKEAIDLMLEDLNKSKHFSIKLIRKYSD